MRLNVVQWGHGETSSNRSGTRCQGANRGRPGQRRAPVARRPSHPASRLGSDYLGANRGPAGSGPSQRAAIAASLPPRFPTGSLLPQLGWSAAGSDDGARREGLPGTLGRTSPQRRHVGGLAPAGGSGRETGPEGRALGGVPSVGTAWVAESSTRHPSSQERSGGASGMEKNFRKLWQPC